MMKAKNLTSKSKKKVQKMTKHILVFIKQHHQGQIQFFHSIVHQNLAQIIQMMTVVQMQQFITSHGYMNTKAMQLILQS